MNGVPGFPFSIAYPAGVVSGLDAYNYQVGFVGKQIPNAALMVREGLRSSDRAPIYFDSDDLRGAGISRLHTERCYKIVIKKPNGNEA